MRSGRISNRTDDAVLDVVLPAEEVEDFSRGRVFEHRVDGQVTPFRVPLERFQRVELVEEDDGVGAATVAVLPVTTEGGNFDLHAIARDDDDAKGFTDQEWFVLCEDALDHIGSGVGRHVVIAWVPHQGNDRARSPRRKRRNSRASSAVSRQPFRFFLLCSY